MTGRHLGAVALIVTASLLAPAAHAHAEPAGDPVARWIRGHAQPLRTTDPDASLADLRPLERSIGAASVVGLGESEHGATEEAHLKFRTLRLLVEKLGYRSLAWEESWTTGRRINRYITTGRGDPRALAGRMTFQWRSAQVADVLRWLRRFNMGRTDQVRFVGVESYAVDRLAYRAVRSYVTDTAPGELPRLRADLEPIWPSDADPFVYAGVYQGATNKRTYIRHARSVLRLLQRLPHRPGDRRYALALANARQIVYFHEYYALGTVEQNVYRERHAAATLRWWQRFTGDRVAYWAASAHTANARDLRMVMPEPPNLRYASAGSYLRSWYGPGYRSIGFTFDHGTIGLAPGETTPQAAPEPGWFERPLGDHQPDRFVLDLRSPAPSPVRTWLTAPLVTRGLPNAVPGATISGGTLAQWFDILVHVQTVTPQDALS